MPLNQGHSRIMSGCQKTIAGDLVVSAMASVSAIASVSAAAMTTAVSAMAAAGGAGHRLISRRMGTVSAGGAGSISARPMRGAVSARAMTRPVSPGTMTARTGTRARADRTRTGTRAAVMMVRRRRGRSVISGRRRRGRSVISGRRRRRRNHIVHYGNIGRGRGITVVIVVAVIHKNAPCQHGKSKSCSCNGKKSQHKSSCLRIVFRLIKGKVFPECDLAPARSSFFLMSHNTMIVCGEYVKRLQNASGYVLRLRRRTEAGVFEPAGFRKISLLLYFKGNKNRTARISALF